MKAKFINEVLRSEDDWANKEIAKYKGEPAINPNDERDLNYVAPDITEEDFEEVIKELNKNSNTRNLLIQDIKVLEEYIWENASFQQLGEWQDFLMYGFGTENWEDADLTIKELQDVFHKAIILVNKLKHKSM